MNYFHTQIFFNKTCNFLLYRYAFSAVLLLKDFLYNSCMPAHPFAPVFDEHSKILILGSFPSVKSRENQFYYGHPQNRFWKVLAAVFEDEVPSSIEEKINFLHQHHIALWDVIATCEITGSADATITNATPNDIAILLKKAPIRKICCNGTKSWELFQKYIQPGMEDKIPAVKLPSTSPANAAWTLEKLVAAWENELSV